MTEPTAIAPYILFSDATFIAFKKELDEKISKLESIGDSGLSKRFEDLKAETEKVLNKFAEDCKKLQEAIETLAASQAETIKKLNVTIDEVRSIGGRNLPARVDPAPAAEVETGMGLSMFDLFD